MAKVKTFTCEVSIFKTKRAFEDLDDAVNQFLKDKQAISVSDAPMTDEKGATIGLTRVVTYE